LVFLIRYFSFFKDILLLSVLSVVDLLKSLVENFKVDVGVLLGEVEAGSEADSRVATATLMDAVGAQ